MAYPTIPYDATSGSDTAPTGNDGSGTNGDWSSTTLTLNETVDFTGVADDDSDYLWVDTPNGSRHLAQITAFNPSVAACTTITTAESSTAAYTADSWAVNGDRKTLKNDTSQLDPDDWMPGWTIELDGTFTLAAACAPGTDTTAGIADLPLTVQASSGASSRPVVDVQSNNYVLETATMRHVFRGIKLLCSTGGGANSYVRVANTPNGVVFDDCVVDTSGGTPDNSIWQASVAPVTMVNCYVTGGVQCGYRYHNYTQSSLSLIHCTFDGQGASYFSGNAVILHGAFTTFRVSNCLIFDCSGAGLYMDVGSANNVIRSIDSCIIVDNGGDGIRIGGTAAATDTLIYISNNIIAYNTAWGIDDEVTNNSAHVYADSNAVYSNTSGQYDANVTAGPNAITLTADPFTHRASNNYTLNDTAGGGALLKGAAYPATMPDGR